MTRRKLTPEEIDLWHKVIEKAERLHPGSMTTQPLPKPKPSKRPLTTAKATHPKPEQKPKPMPRAVAKPSGAAVVNMDTKAFSRMKRGKLSPEGRIDLHGMTLSQAQPELTRFILSSQASGRRLVLVITGKGKPNSEGTPFHETKGVLRRYVPQWLAMHPLSHAVLQVNPAHVSHGGDGAFYVYLKKIR